MPWCLNCEMEITLLCLAQLGIYQNECFCIDQKWVSANWLRFTSVMSLSTLLYVKAAKLHISKIWSSFTKQIELINSNIFDTVVVTHRKKKVGDEFSKGKLTADDIWIEKPSNTHCSIYMQQNKPANKTVFLKHKTLLQHLLWLCMHPVLLSVLC